MYKKVLGFVVVLMVMFAFAKAQHSTWQNDTIVRYLPKANSALFIDSVQVKAVDTLTPNVLKIRDSLTNAIWLDSLNNGYGFEVFSLQKLVSADYDIAEIAYQQGEILPKGEVWILAIIGFLLVLFSILKNAFGKQFSAVVQSFYSNRALSNLNKEDNLITSWSFLLLFIQFGFTIGMFFYLVVQYRDLPQAKGGFVFFVTISTGVILLYLLKILVLRFLGFVFNIQKPLNQYISILYLSYFNASLLFFPIVIAFALSPATYSYSYALLGVSALLFIFVFQFIRAATNILSQYRFPKLYLFLYLCTLEICPILILIKAVGL